MLFKIDDINRNNINLSDIDKSVLSDYIRPFSNMYNEENKSVPLERIANSIAQFSR